MLFRIVPSRKSPGQMWCHVEGSLHRYALDGAANVGDFTFEHVRETIREFCARFHVSAGRAALENVEIGVNVTLPVPAAQFLKTLICHGSAPFVELNKDRPGVGKYVARDWYAFKIYDKGRQADTGETHVLRIELKVTKMEFLKPHGIETLADLIDPAKAAPLGQLLAGSLAKSIVYDGSISDKALTERERLALKDFCNPKWWADLDKRSRYYYRQAFARMMEKHGANSVFLNVVSDTLSQWQKLVNGTRKSLDFLTGSDGNGARENLDFLTVRMKGEKVQLGKSKYILPDRLQKLPDPSIYAPAGPPPLSVKSSTFCECCGRDISGQRQGSRYCSPARFGPTARRCRDKGRRQRQAQARRIEAEQLAALLPDLLALAASLTVFALDPADRSALHVVATVAPAQVAGRRVVPIRPAVRVEVLTVAGERLAFTRRRAKRLLVHLAGLRTVPDPPPKPDPPPERKPLPPGSGHLHTLGDAAADFLAHLKKFEK
ncbi:MAG: hypothetical protein U0U46_16285 [Saprospiraceae bacterium]